MFAALSSAEFQWNEFSAAEYKRVSIGKKPFILQQNFFEVFCGPFQPGPIPWHAQLIAMKCVLEWSLEKNEMVVQL